MIKINKRFMESIKPVELEYIASYILNVYLKKDDDYKPSNYENLVGSICKCPYCHLKSYKRNGKAKNQRQRYLCKNCHRSFSITTNTIFFHDKCGYKTWKKFIVAELKGETLEQEAYSIKKSITTCFNMRQKLYASTK